MVSIQKSLAILAEKYGFQVAETKEEIGLYCTAANGHERKWLSYKKATNQAHLAGNTVLCNLWFSKTRPDLTAERLLELVPDLNDALDMGDPYLLRELIGKKDWEAIAGIDNAEEDPRWSKNIFLGGNK